MEQRNKGTKKERNKGTKEQRNKVTKEQKNNGTTEQRNKGTKEQRNKGTKKQKVHPIGSGITRSPGLVFTTKAGPPPPPAWFSGGPRIPPNPNCLKNRKIIQNAKTQKMSRNMPKLAIRPSTRDL